MALFQNSVLKKYLKQENSDAVAKSFKKFAKYFHDSKIQENIRLSKEEEYQGIFLTELFSKILGYTMKPNANFNLVAEYKNEKNSRKADGAILKDNEALGVIELKGTNTKDLEKVRQQAFDYKSNQTGCVYVITSNFEKIRFYINNAVDFEEFDLFNLNQERFELLYLCLAQENLLNNIPLKIKEASVQEEEAITKKFYKDYSTFKRELFRDLVKLNMKNEVFSAELNNEDADRANKNIKHNLFKKSQKLIDRFLFIFFAEDRGLLPPNSTVQILEQWNKLKDLDAYTPLYQRYQLYFTYLDQGRKGTDKRAEIFAYNGGLFKPDPVLDSLKVSDELLAKHTSALQAYDFESQVDVNILGHIFENSLNEIESVNTKIEGADFDKQTTKRKKDGVFYTPKYITKYIVDNTIGKLCNEKKTELGVIEEDYLKSRKGRSKAKLQELLDSIEAYREWLLKITILDPACGSGAFLNQALDFLINEHQYIDELQAKLLGGGFVFPDIENTVLENNIFGVDINEESVEIAKLSLWLRTAQPRRKLNDLSSNIKCGNSLIDSKNIAGEKAFKWEDEYSQIFENGGFDVVIGNPPYVRPSKMDINSKEFYWKTYKSFKAKSDLYSIFMEKGIFLTKGSGLISYIVPHTWVSLESFEEIRKIILSATKVKELTRLPKKVFSDATVETCIFLLEKNVDASNTNDVLIKKLNINEEKTLFEFKQKLIIESHLHNFQLYTNFNGVSILNKIKKSPPLSEFVELKYGFKTGDDDKFISDTCLSDEYKKFIRSGDIKRYYFEPANEYVLYNPKLMRDNKKTARPGESYRFEQDKIIVSRMGKGIEVVLDESGIYIKDAMLLSSKNNANLKYITALLNSNLINYYYREYFNTIDVLKNALLSLPIKINTDLYEFMNHSVDVMLEKKNKAYNFYSSFSKYIEFQFSGIVLNNHIQNWYELEFGDFIKELNKAIKKAGREKLTKIDEMDWMEVFETKKAEAQTLKTEIDKTDREIDEMVYELYGLTNDEIKIVEES